VPGAFTVSGRAGADTLHFSGRLAGHALSAGRYRLLATPRSGVRSGATASAPFQILARATH
jgi:hypothetical protein